MLLPYIQWEMPLKRVLTQDNDPKHTSRRAKNWLLQNRIKILEGPVVSRLHTQLKIYGLMLKKAYLRSTLEELWEIAQLTWQSISAECPLILCFCKSCNE
ncbi:putative phosphatidylinositol-3,4-bisphosphate 4-phosphatase [Trypoxylus dichotomus]